MCFEFKHKYVQVPTKWTIKRICLWMIGWNFSAPIKVLDMLLLCTPHVRERSHICWWTFFVINPQRSARPTSLLWRLSVSETGIVDRADQSSYHTLRQIAHGLFGGGGSPPFWIQWRFYEFAKYVGEFHKNADLGARSRSDVIIF